MKNYLLLSFAILIILFFISVVLILENSLFLGIFLLSLTVTGLTIIKKLLK